MGASFWVAANAEAFAPMGTRSGAQLGGHVGDHQMPDLPHQAQFSGMQGVGSAGIGGGFQRGIALVGCGRQLLQHLIEHAGGGGAAQPEQNGVRDRSRQPFECQSSCYRHCGHSYFQPGLGRGSGQCAHR